MISEKRKSTPGKPNPAAKANPLSRLTFMYMWPIIFSKYKTGLTEDDLFDPLDEHKSQLLGSKLERIWKKENVKHKKAALHIALFKMFGLQLTVIGVLKGINEVLMVVLQPLAIGNLVLYFQTGGTEVTESQAFINAGILIGCLIFDALISHPTMMSMMHIAMKLRIACGSLIYRKALRLHRNAFAQTTVGQMVNLLSNDVSKFDQGFVLAHFFWIGPLQTAVGIYLLYRIIGLSAIFGLLFLMSFIPLQIFLGKRTSVLRLRIALRTDERVRLMNEIVSGIQVIKMYTWEKPFAKIISFARRKEIQAIKQHRYLVGSIYSFEIFVIRTSIFISVLTFVLMGNSLTAQIVFSVTAIYNVLNTIITTLFTISITSLAEVNVSLKRMQNFMKYEEIDPQLTLTPPENSKPQKNGYNKNETPKIILRDVSAKWLEESPQETLKNININITNNQLFAIIGPVGSGKSSLLNVILKELPTTKGDVTTHGTISYSSQEPWLFNDTIRNNITFCNPYDENRYKKIIQICSLESDLDMFPYGDRTLVGEKGKTLSGGQKARINLARCIYKEADIYLLDDPLSAVDANVGKQLYENCIKDFLKSKICVLNTHQLQYLANADVICVMKDGEIQVRGDYESLQSSGYDFADLLKEISGKDDLDEVEVKGKVRSDSGMEISEDESEDEAPEAVKEVLGKGSIKAGVYKEYFKSGGNWFLVLLLVAAFISAQGVGSLGDYVVSYWVDFEQDVQTQEAKNETIAYESEQRSIIIYLYSGLILATILLAIGHSVFYFIFCLYASTHIHDWVFSKVIKATMNFFNNNPTGRIINRFSKDFGIVDEYIPNVMYDVIEIGLLLLGSITLTCVVNPWLIIPSAIFISLFYIFRTIYIKISRSAKRIEAIKRSPIYGQMLTTVNGLATIRAFKAEKMLIDEFDTNQDNHSSSWFLFIASSRTFGFYLDVVCITFISGITFGLLAFNKDLYGGEIGLVITQCIGLMGSLQWGVRQWSELENQMTSVERILEYTKVENEPQRKQIAKPKNWPEFGKIQFKNLYLRYNTTDPYVLKNINFTINPREKIGIVGRTGAGKSSIIAALFQLYEIEGQILIDDIDCTQLPLEEVRSKISIIPQEPVLFSGTMRSNLDPFDEYPDELLWNALEQVEMKTVVSSASGGLNMRVTEGGANYSVGQRQLICLARAIIRNNKILVMDEATANVDPYTDGLIQSTIRKKFKDCTVLTIAHRLHTVMDSDRIMVVNAGKIEEFDHPKVLLKNKDGFLYQLVQKTGQTTARNLNSVAEENYSKKFK